MSAPSRLGILISGRGSNMVALAQACAAGELPAEVRLVVSNVEGAPGLERAQSLGLPTAVVRHRDFATREAFERALVGELRRAEVEWVCLAGFMRLLSPFFVREFPRRVLNVHPSLLPAFPGLEAQTQALTHGVRWSGCTVHLVDEGLDSGPIVEQRVVAVADGDTPATLSARILEVEHLAYVGALRRLLIEPWAISGRRLEFGATTGA